jgi:hypothetical protein
MLRPRYRWVAALVVAVAVLCPAASAVDVKYLPDETELVITVSLKQIRTSELVMKETDALDQPRAVLNRLADDLPVLKCLQIAGLDFFRDLTSITFAAPAGMNPRAKFLILEGDFDTLKLTDLLAARAKACPDALKAGPSGGTVVYEMGTAAETRNYAVLVNKTTLIAATTREALADALARSDGSKKAGLKPGLKTLLQAASEKESISFAATGVALAPLLDGSSIPNADTAAAALKSVDGLTGAVTLAKDVQFQVGIYARDDETAKKLADAGGNALLTLRGLMKQKAKEDEILLPAVKIVNTLRVRNQGPILLLAGEATLDAIEKLMKSAPVGHTETGPARLGPGGL